MVAISLYVLGRQVTGMQFFGFSVFLVFGVRYFTSAVSHSGLESSSKYVKYRGYMLVCCCKLLKPKIWYLVSSRGLPV